MELTKLVNECIEALQEEAGTDYAYYSDDEPFGAKVRTESGLIDMYYDKGNVEVQVYHDNYSEVVHTNLEGYLSDALADCVDWTPIKEEWRENRMDEYQRNGFNSAADFWRWKEG